MVKIHARNESGSQNNLGSFIVFNIFIFEADFDMKSFIGFV